MVKGLQHIANVYFLGIGGIGMSALARYFKHLGKNVAGYDLTQTTLTNQLSASGINVHYNDDINAIPENFLKENTLVVYTPAIPEGHKEFNFLKQKGYGIYKRAQVLGLLCNEAKTIAVAGTHGKTTVSTMVSVILKNSQPGCSAFLGGISKNFGSNLVLPGQHNEWIVTEADEYDRSFLNLKPTIALITAIDPDHLDIYGNLNELKKSFADFSLQIKEGGKLIVKKGISLPSFKTGEIKILTYSLNESADYFAENIRQKGLGHMFDLKTPEGVIEKIELSYPGLINVENAVGAASLALEAGVSTEELKNGLGTFEGVRRRFDVRFRNKSVVFIDDYAHHPKELEAVITSVRKLFPGKKITGIFQPHLYSRTKDFAGEFAQSLSLLDEVVALPIYPARELPIKGVTSEIITSKIKTKKVTSLQSEELTGWISGNEFEVLLTLGAGNIDKAADEIVEILRRRYNA